MGSSQSSQSKPKSSESQTVLNEKCVLELAHDLSTTHIDAAVPQPTSADGSLSLQNVDFWETAVSKDPKTQLSRTVLHQTNFQTVLTSRETFIADRHVFNHELDFKTGPITSQKSSGRCWLFATTNVLRYSVMKKLGLSEFQLSQAYPFFWDKLNKSNYFLEMAIQTADAPLDDRVVNYLTDEVLSDGGQWDMAVNLLETYGAVPQHIYPESFVSSNSSGLNKLIKLKLREHALVLRQLHDSLRSNDVSSSKGDGDDESIMQTLRAKKETLLAEIWSIMTATLGVPPRPDVPFTYDYYDKDGKAHSWTGTPVEFYKQFRSEKYPPAECFSLINDPRNSYKQLYTVEKLGNLWGGRPVLYVNTEIADLKAAVVAMIKAGHPVFFGCDVGQFSDRTAGIMDTALHQYENAFNITLILTKAQRLQLNESSMTHAMVISGVHLDDSGKPVRYKVENSWGEDVGDKGYFVMTDRWFNEFVYQVVVPKSLAPKELVEVFEKGEKTVLPPWDPMGSLA